MIFTALFLAPFVYFFVIGFWTVRGFRLVPNFSFSSYGRVLDRHLGSLLLTLGLSLLVASVTTGLGFVYAFIARFKAGRFGGLFLFTALVTLFGGYLMKIYAWKTILGNEGVLNTGLRGLGLIDEPITALFYTPEAVVVTLVHFLLPLTILPIYSSLRGVMESEIEAARDLGAGFWRILLDILLPRCRTGIMAGFLLAFLLTAGDYVTPLLVGGTMVMIGNIIAPQFGQYFNWPLGSALSFVTLAASLLVVALVNLGLGRVRPR